MQPDQQPTAVPQSRLQQTLAAVASLNRPDQPFEYRVEGNTIVGYWKYLDAVWAAPIAAGTIDKEFRVTVTLDETTQTYASVDTALQAQSAGSFDSSSNGIGFSFGSSSKKGHMMHKEIGFGFGHAQQPQNETPVGGPTFGWRIDTDEIKQPLFAFLQSYGWQKKRGFFGKLFG